jgi:ribose transport system permease protein
MSADKTHVAAPEAASPRRFRLSRPGDVGSWSPIAAFVVIFVVFSILRPHTYFTSSNVLSVLSDQSVLAIVTLGLTVVLLAGQFDLSIGSIFSLTGALVAGLVSKNGVDPALAILAVIALGAAIGVINGVVVAYLQVPSLIITLAAATVLDGLTLWYTNGSVISQGIPKSFVDFGRTSFGQLGIPVVYMAALAILLWGFLKYTPAGRRLQSVGGNRRAAWLAGVRINRYTVLAFAISGGCAAFAGALQTARNASANPTQGTSFLLPAFAAAFLGSVTLRRSEFHVFGSLIGVYLVAFTVSGLFITGSAFWVQYIFTGLALAIAVAAPRIFSRGSVA